jgi:hypothetical protein
LQAELKILKKIIGTNQNKKFLKKTVFRTLKVERSQNLYGGYPTDFAGSTQNPKKMTGTRNLPIKKKIFPKKYTTAQNIEHG